MTLPCTLFVIASASLTILGVALGWPELHILAIVYTLVAIGAAPVRSELGLGEKDEEPTP